MKHSIIFMIFLSSFFSSCAELQSMGKGVVCTFDKVEIENVDNGENSIEVLAKIVGFVCEE